MTLEDFFTLTEMKNGLTTCTRVEELICVMQNQSCITDNVEDAARQWSTAASALASTQYKECLDHFVHLNGLGYINHWLHEAVECSRDIADGEELINTLLGSLNKLPMNPVKLNTSGIFATVEKLVCHKNVIIKQRACILFEKWRTNNESYQEVEVEKCISYSLYSSIPSNDAASIEAQSAVEVGIEGSCKIESSDDGLHLGDADEVKDSICNQTSPACSSSENDHVLTSTTSASDACQVNLSGQGASFIPSSELAFSSTPTSPEIHVLDDEQYKISAMNDAKSDLNNWTGDSWEFRETSSVLSSSGLTAASCTKNHTVVLSASCNPLLKRCKSNLSEKSLHKCATVDGVWLDYLKGVKVLKSSENGSTDLIDSPTQECSWREAAENINVVELCNDSTPNVCNEVDRLIAETSGVQISREKVSSSDSDLGSGEIDALEIARQVAIQVEREVFDYREELCSSPEMSSNEIMNTESPNIVRYNRGHPIPGESIGNLSIPINHDCEFTPSSKFDKHVVAEIVINPPTKDQNVEPSNGAAVIHESSSRARIAKFDFDLNEDACNEDVNCVVNPINPNNLANLSAPIAVFASKGAPGFLIIPPCFQGGLGWKGSAPTSAFRLASPRRTIKHENAESVLKYKTNLTGLDLNLSYSENYLQVDTASMKEVPISSCMPSWNSASEVSSLTTERIKLDLNSNGEEEATPSQSSFIKHHFRDPSSSPASSSVPPRQASLENFDLNDNLFLSDSVVFKDIGVKSDDQVMTIMGSTMSLERRVHTNQAHLSYMGNGLSFDATLASLPMLPYSHQLPHPSFGYIGMAAEMALPFQPAVYGLGNIQYIQKMVDYRGDTALPQFLDSPGVTVTTPPFVMSITSTTSSSNGDGPSHSGLDLNFGVVQMDSGTGIERNLKHPFMPFTSSLTEEHIKTTLQQDISGNSLKRKEPDCGWEPFSFGCKHAMSWR